MAYVRRNYPKRIYSLWFSINRIKYIKYRVGSIANLNCDEVSPVEVAPYCTIPLLLGHSLEDDFVPSDQSMLIFNAYKGEKHFIPLHDGHNSPRSEQWFNECNKFIANCLQLPSDKFDHEIKEKNEIETYFDFYQDE